MGKKSSSAPPPPDPRLFEVMNKQVAQGDDLISFIKQSYEEQKPLQERQSQLSEAVAKQNMNLAQNAEDRANDSYNFYKNEGRPVIQQSLRDAQDWDSADNIDKARGQASADIQSSMDKEQAGQNRMLTRMGINPNSTKFAQVNQNLMAQKALATAGAMNQAGEQRKTQAVQLRQQAGNLASGMPAQSMGFAGQASGMGTAAAGVGAQNLAGLNATRGSYASGIGQGSSMYASAGSQYNQLYGTQMQGYGQQQQAASSSSAGLGSLAGTAMMAGAMMMADGGQVRGPGSGTSDSVPAFNSSNGQPIKLSNGEYVISADVVRAKGREFFDKLQDRYHTPVGNLGRAA